MFHYIGNLVAKRWPVFIGGWAILLLVCWLCAPDWEKVVGQGDFAFLPKDVPSRRSEELFKKAFPSDRTGSNIVLVLSRSADDQPPIPEARKFVNSVLVPAISKIAEAEGGLASQPAPETDLWAPETVRETSIIFRIRTPGTPGAGWLVSADRHVALVVVDLTTEFGSEKNWPTIEKVETLVQELLRSGETPAGLGIEVTGSAVIGRDLKRAEAASTRATEKWTIALVVILLILIYRAPLLALIPLVTVFLSVKMAMSLLALMAQAGWITLFEGAQIFITILTYGAGVDYCLFLIARCREELETGADMKTAVARALGNVGMALTASAGTVMLGIGMMWFARFGKFHEAGFAIPFSLLVVILASLTFSPALLLLAGRWAFWPHMNQSEKPTEPAAWQRLWQFRLIQGGWERIAALVLARPGRIWTMSIMLMLPFALLAIQQSGRFSYDFAGTLPEDYPSVQGTRLMQTHFPPGLMGPMTVLVVDPQADFSSEQGFAEVGEMTQWLKERSADLGLADIRSLTAPLGHSRSPNRLFTKLDLPDAVVQDAVREGSIDYYVTDLGERSKIGTRFEVIATESPFSLTCMNLLDKLERDFHAAFPSADVHVLGTTASMRDLKNVTTGDRVRINVLVLAAVFLVLLLLLRKAGVSLYLVLSVLFSYYATLGVTTALFWLLQPTDFAGLDWKVPIFLFTILIAVGEDYNIFLMTRVHEEQEVHGSAQGIATALTRTGPIISSCGLVMAGTFASLLAGTLIEMKQMGFALVFGVLLDTFVVRPILVPAFLLMIAKHRLIPKRWLPRRTMARP